MAWVVIGETFPLRTRSKQASLATAANWLGNCKPQSPLDVNADRTLSYDLLLDSTGQ